MTQDLGASASPSALNPSAGKLLKAFAVLEEDEGTGGIVFAKSAIAARREGANEYADGDFGAVRCNRAPWADGYAATGGVPVWLMVFHGWHFECAGCGVRIDSDMLWERDLEPEDVQGTQHSMAFCTPLCEARHNLERAEAKHRETRWIRRFKKIVKRRFPDAEIIENDDRFCRPHAYATTRGTGVWRVEQVIVSFRWPGQQWGPASLRIDTTTEWSRNAPSVTKRGKPHWTCSSGDREAFEEYARASAMSARSGETEGLAPEAASAVPQADAQNTEPAIRSGKEPAA